MELRDLKKNLKKDFSRFKKIKLAFLADTASQFIVQAIKGWGYEFSYDLDIFEADFNQIERQILDSTSELYEHEPEVTIVFESSHKLLYKFNKLPSAKKESFAQDRIDQLEMYLQALSSKMKTKVIYFNIAEIDDNVFGNHSNKVSSSFVFQVRKLNYLLMEKASQAANLYICDLSSVQNRYGKERSFSPSIYVNTEMILSVDIVPKVAFNVVNMLAAMNGKIKKCLILDLDNTLWGGVIGDDGIENIQLGMLGIGKAFTEFQLWIKALQQRGIILAVCSKNDEDKAKAPFEKHPDMVLKLDDIAVFVANWENKADNIRKIQRILNIGFDSMVFLDDNPFERNMVRANVEGVLVPELPEDPAEYLEYLYTLNLFETTSFSGEDTERTKLYQVEAERVTFHQKFTDENEFLKSLDMLSDVQPFNSFNTPRVAQLSQRSNQFNLRTVRYTEDDIKRVAEDNNYYTLTFTLEDKFGDNGLISAIILQQEDNTTLFIDTWFMSCRVLKRGMENFILNTIIETAKNNGYSKVKGEYIPTEKNGMVKDHYKNLGFEQEEGFWVINTEKYENKPCYISKK